MQKLLLTAISIWAIIPIFSQVNLYTFDWQEGDTKQIKFTSIQKEYLEETLILDTTTYFTADLTVLKSDNDFVEVELNYDNIAFTEALYYYPTIFTDLSAYTKMQLQFSIDKKTLAHELINFAEVEQFVTVSFDAIKTTINEQDFSEKNKIEKILTELEATFKSSEAIEAYFEQDLRFLLLPYNKRFVKGDPIITKEIIENPLSPKDSLASTTTVFEKMIRKDINISVIEENVELDLSALKKTFMEMIFGFAESDEELDFEMTNDNLSLITFDYNLNWVTDVFSTTNVTMKIPEVGNMKIVNIIALELQ